MNTARLFSLNAARASKRSWLESKVSYDALSKSKPGDSLMRFREDKYAQLYLVPERDLRIVKWHVLQRVEPAALLINSSGIRKKKKDVSRLRTVIADLRSQFQGTLESTRLRGRYVVNEPWILK